MLFLDEPTTGLDPASRLTVWDEVRRINERGTTVFLTTQYLEEADRAVRPARDHRRRPDRARGHAAAASRPTCGSGAGSAADPTLDDVFLDATGRTRERGEGDVQEVTA